MSFFDFQRVAEGYARYRPYYHPIIMGIIRQKLSLKEKLDHVLDIGCGTGLSTVALTELSDKVTGIDSSEEMLTVANANANRDGKINYHQSLAEELPFDADKFDLITICGAINWIDRNRFFPEAKRVINEKGWVIIYDNFITERIRGNLAYTQWYREQFLTRYPKPPRDETPLTQSECEGYGFWFYHEDYTNELAWSKDAYIEYMLTQSNVIVSVDMGDDTVSGARKWMHQTLAPILPDDEKGVFQFAGYIWYVQQVNESRNGQKYR